MQIQLNDDAFKRLEKEAEEYSRKSITRYFPLRIFDDYKDESLKILKYIEKRRPDHKDLFGYVERDDMKL
jgi:hypothetical protein